MAIQMTIDLPEELGLDEADLKWRLAAKLFDERLITKAQAATLIGTTLEGFILGVGKYGVSLLQYSPEELEEEVREMMAESAEGVE